MTKQPGQEQKLDRSPSFAGVRLQEEAVRIHDTPISRRRLLAAFGAAMIGGIPTMERAFAAEAEPAGRAAGGTLEAHNVKRYGALGNGSNDDSEAFQRAVDEIASAGKGVLYIPKGDYRIDKLIVKQINTWSLSVIGDGQGLSNLLGNNAEGVFGFVHQQRTPQITIRDLTFIAMRPGSGTAIEINQPEGGNRHNRTLVVQNVQICPADQNTDYFDYGIRSIGQYRPQFWNVSVSGPYGSDLESNTDVDSPMLRGKCGIQADGSYAPSFQHCQVWSMQLGFSIVSKKRPGPEGCFLYRSTAVNCLVGVDVGTAGVEPGLVIDACHFRCRDAGARLKRKYFSVTNSLFENVSAGGGAASPYVDIALSNSDGAVITGNIFGEYGGSNRVMIELAGRCSDISIKENLFRAKGTAISAGDQVKDIICCNNRYTGQGTQPIKYSGEDVIFGTQQFRGALLLRTSVQDIPDGTWTDVKWETAEYDTNRFAGTGGRVVIPPGLGIRFVKLSANVTWSGSEEGWRQAEFIKNGEAFAGGGISGEEGAAVLNFESPVIPVTDGDLLQVRVRQSSGNTMQLHAGSDTWFAMEAING